MENNAIHMLVAEYANAADGLRSYVQQVSAIAFKVVCIDTDADAEVESRIIMDRVNGANNSLADKACALAKSFVTGVKVVA